MTDTLERVPMRETEYAIKLTDSGWYACERRQWRPNPADALHFATMTSATIAAIEVLGLAPEAFSVEAV